MLVCALFFYPYLYLHIHTRKGVFVEPSFLVLNQQAQHRNTSIPRKLHLAPPISICMMVAASIYNDQTSTAECYRAPSPTASLSPTLVNDAHNIERPSPLLKLSFTCSASNILNSAVINAAGQSLYSISSDSKRTTMVSCRDNAEVASIQWDRYSPRMVFRCKKMKCKEWLKRAEPGSKYIRVTHQFLLSF